MSLIDRYMMRLVLVIAVGSCLAAAAHARLGWEEYRNDRFGPVLRYPADVFQPQRAAVSGDGYLFASKDGEAQLLVGAFENREGHSPASYQRFIRRHSYPGVEVDYAPIGRSWMVLSGYLDDKTVYEKVMFSCNGRVINSFAMIYPTAGRDFYDPIVEEIEDTFRPVPTTCPRHAGAF